MAPFGSKTFCEIWWIYRSKRCYMSWCLFGGKSFCENWWIYRFKRCYIFMAPLAVSLFVKKNLIIYITRCHYPWHILMVGWLKREINYINLTYVYVSMTFSNYRQTHLVWCWTNKKCYVNKTNFGWTIDIHTWLPITCANSLLSNFFLLQYVNTFYISRRHNLKHYKHMKNQDTCTCMYMYTELSLLFPGNHGNLIHSL